MRTYRNERPGVRRYAPTRTRGAASAVAVSQARLRRTHPENAAIDESAGGCTTDPRRCAGVCADGGGAASWRDRSRLAVNASSGCTPPTARPDILADERHRHRGRRCSGTLSQMATRFERVGESLATLRDTRRRSATTRRSKRAGPQRRIQRPYRRRNVPCRFFNVRSRSIRFCGPHAQLGFRTAGGEVGPRATGLPKAYQLRNRASDAEPSSSTRCDRDFTGNLERATNVGNVGRQPPRLADPHWARVSPDGTANGWRSPRPRRPSRWIPT